MILEQRTAFGTEYIEYKKQKDNYYGKTLIFIRKKWNAKPKGKWMPTKFTSEDAFKKSIGEKYKTSNEWDKIQKKQRETRKKAIPNIVKLEKIDSDIRQLERRMINGKINSLTEKQKQEYYKLLKERRRINII